MDLVGRTIGRIEVLETLGEGGMGTVYLGWDAGLERKVALKALRPGRDFDEETRARFLREARILSQLEHPGICRIHDLLSEDGVEVLVLEYVEGRTLKEEMSSGLSAAGRLRIAEQLAAALVVAHSAGVVHRDLKPDNVLVTSDGTAKVLDFGLARSLPRELPQGEEMISAVETSPRRTPRSTASASERVDDTDLMQTQVGSVIGTVAYMSPEQARGDAVTLASDMYSLGIIFHELFTGSPAYPREMPLAERLRVVAELEPRQSKESILSSLG